MKTLKCLFVGFMILGLVSMFSVAQADLIMVPDPDNGINTIQDAVNAANPAGGDVIMVGQGNWTGPTVDRQVEIIGCGEAIINDGPDVDWEGETYIAGFFIPDGINHNADGTKISNFSIIGPVEFSVFARGADDITVSHLTITGCYLGIFNAGGSGWEITHNKIYNLSIAPYTIGHKLGIFIRGTDDYDIGNVTENNLIAFNDIDIDMSALSPEDQPLCGGVVFMVYPGDVGPMHNNKVVHNKIKVNGGAIGFPEMSASFVDVDVPYAFFASVTNPNISGNYIGFNDFRGSQLPMYFLPFPNPYLPPPLPTDRDLEEHEIISRNLDGDSRAIFDPTDAPEDVWQFRPIM